MNVKNKTDDTGKRIERSTELLYELFNLFRDKAVGKGKEARNRAGQKTYAYYSLEDVMVKINETLKDTKFFYTLDVDCAALYHREYGLLRVVEVDLERMNNVKAGDVSIMSPEQRFMSQATFAAKLLLTRLFCITVSDDPDAMYSELTAKKHDDDKTQELYKKALDFIQSTTVLADLEDGGTVHKRISENEVFTVAQKSSLNFERTKRRTEMEKQKISETNDVHLEDVL